ncbi:MAG: Fe-S protein assembly co-chaperone HscB [Rickettsiales bacterium]
MKKVHVGVGNHFTFRMNNYFEIFNLTPDFLIDLDFLESQYLKLSKKYHPDKFRDQESKKSAYQNTITINKAYETLNSDVLRAEYLMKLNDITLGTESDSIKPTQELLINMLDLREELEEISNKENLDTYEKKISTLYEKSKSEFSKNFTKQDLEDAAQSAIKLRYYSKAIEEIQKKFEKLDAD